MLGMLWNCRESMGLETEIKKLFNKQELKNLSADDVNEALAKELYYDEYTWQYEKKMSITYPKRADGIENLCICILIAVWSLKCILKGQISSAANAVQGEQ